MTDPQPSAEEILIERTLPEPADRKCPKCRKGDLLMEGRGFSFLNEFCDYRWAACARCKTWWNRG